MDDYDLSITDKSAVKKAKLSSWVMEQLEQGMVPDISLSLLPKDARARFEAKMKQRNKHGDLVYNDEAIAAQLLVTEIEAAQKTPFRDMTFEEMQALSDTIRLIEHQGKLKLKLVTASDQRSLDEAVQDIVQQTIENAKEHGKLKPEPVDKLGRFFKASNKFVASHLRASSIAIAMDGGEIGGPMWNYLVRPANSAQDKETALMAETAERIEAIMKPLLKSAEWADLKLHRDTAKDLPVVGNKLNQALRKQFYPTVGRSLNWQQRFAILLNVGNEQNLQRLLDGYGWTMQQIQPVLQSFSKEELLAAQAIWDEFGRLWPEAKRVGEILEGKAPEQVPVRPITIVSKDGEEVTLPGGYYPAVYDKNLSVDAATNSSSADVKAQLAAARGYATLSRGFAKSRAEKVKRPVLLSLDGMYQGFSESVHAIAWAEWLQDANKLLNPRGKIAQTIKEHYGDEVFKALTDWRDRMAAGSQDKAGADAFFGFIRQHVSAATFFFQFQTALTQWTGFTNSGVLIGWKAFNDGAFYTIKNPKEAFKEMMVKSSFMAHRTRTRIREVNELRNKIEGTKGVVGRIAPYGYAPMMYLQLMVDAPTWWGEYRKSLNEGLDESSAVARADQAVKTGQTGGESVDLSRIEDTTATGKLFTVFYGFMGATMNLYWMTKKTSPTPKMMAQWATMLIGGATIFTATKLLLAGGDADDWEDWVKKQPGEAIDFGMSLFVGFRELNGLGKIITGQGGFSYSGPAGLRPAADVTRLGMQLSKDEWDERVAWALLDVYGDFTGFPSLQVKRTVQGARALAEGETQNPMALLMGHRD